MLHNSTSGTGWLTVQVEDFREIAGLMNRGRDLTTGLPTSGARPHACDFAGAFCGEKQGGAWIGFFFENEGKILVGPSFRSLA